MHEKLPDGTKLKPYYTDGVRIGKLLQSSKISSQRKVVLLFMSFAVYTDLLLAWIEFMDYLGNSCTIPTIGQSFVLNSFRFAVFAVVRLYYLS